MYLTVFEIIIGMENVSLVGTSPLSSNNRPLSAPFALSDPSESPRARPLALGLTLGLAPSPGARGVLMTRRVFAASVFC